MRVEKRSALKKARSVPLFDARRNPCRAGSQTKADCRATRHRATEVQSETNVKCLDATPFSLLLWLQRLKSFKNSKLRAWLADSIMSFWDVELDEDHPLTAKVYQDLIKFSSDWRHRIFWLEGVFNTGVSLPISAEWLEILDTIGRKNTWMSAGKVRNEYVEDIVHHFCAYPDQWKEILNVITKFDSER